LWLEVLRRSPAHSRAAAKKRARRHCNLELAHCHRQHAQLAGNRLAHPTSTSRISPGFDN
jgi:hypothetical protein